MDGLEIKDYEIKKYILEILNYKKIKVQEIEELDNNEINIYGYTEELITCNKYLIKFLKSDKEIEEEKVILLYGLVMSKFINKGILMTNKTFSLEAINFAKKHNLELIDGNKFILLNSELIYKESDKFYNNLNFNKAEYIKLKNDLKENNPYSYSNLQGFFKKYIIKNEYEINISGLIDEYIYYNNKFIEITRKNSKRVDKKEEFLIVNYFLYLLKGDIINSINIIKEISFYTKGFVMIGFKEWNDYLIKQEKNYFYDSTLCLLVRNLLILFKHIDFNEGIEIIIDCFKKDENEFLKNLDDSKKNQYKKIGDDIFIKHSEENYKKAKEVFDQEIDLIMRGIDQEILIPLSVEIDKLHNILSIKFSNNNKINVNELINNYKLDVKVIKENLLRNKNCIYGKLSII